MNSINENARGGQIDDDIRLPTWWRIAAVLGVSIPLAGFAVFYHYLRPGLAWRWLLPSLATEVYILMFLKNAVKLNTRKNEGRLLTTLGIANWITLWRGIMISVLAGFFLWPWTRLADEHVWWAWLPGTVYLLAAVLDYFDGFFARLMGHETRLGELFDTQIDALGLLVASLFAIKVGQLPIYYLSVGLACYLFRGGVWLRKKLSKPINELMPYPGARLVAGFQMGFIGVVLLPVLRPPVTSIAALIFMVPFLLGFLRDWLVVCDKKQTDHRQQTSWEKKLHGFFTVWVPLCLRFLIIVAAVALACKLISADPELHGMLRQHFFYWPDSNLGIIFIILFILLGVGILGRLTALFLGLSAGYLIVSGEQAIEYYLIFVSACCLLLTGSGLFSIWQPEDKIILGNRYKETELLKSG